MSARQMALDLLMPLLIGMVASRRSDGSDDESISQIRAAIAALEADIAQAVEPVAWIDGDSIVSFGNMKYGFIDRRDRAIPDSWIPLYAAEPAVNAELLVMLVEMVAWYDGNSRMIHADLVSKARAAIAKATS